MHAPPGVSTQAQPGHEYSASLPAKFPASWASDWGEDVYGLWMAFCYRGIRQQLRWIAPGAFIMGSPASEPERSDSETPHQVVLSCGFWLADTTCTQALWQAMLGDNPSCFRGADRPVENVSWNDVQRFLARLNETAPELAFRLPTEAEWEYGLLSRGRKSSEQFTCFNCRDHEMKA